MDLVGYVRVALDGALADVRSRAEQERALAAWAKRNGHRIVEFAVDEGRTASGPVGQRAALADALEAIRDGRARGVAVCRLDRLAPDVLIQEHLRAEIVRSGGTLFSLAAADAGALADPDPTRALIRETIASVPSFSASLRDLRVRNRMRRSTEDDGAVLARIDALAEHGATDGDIRSVVPGGHRLVRLMRLLRRREA